MNKYINCERSKIVDRLIWKEILTLANGLFEKLLNDSDYCLYDEIENLHMEFESDKNGLCCNCSSPMQPEEVPLNDMGECVDCFDSPMHEVFQWWIVSDFLYERLQEVGEVVCDVEGVYFWGRTACGIALEYDYCFKKIATNIYNTGLKDSEKLEV